MARAYSPSSYDDYFCLKPPALLWLAAIYLSRALLLVVIYVVSSMTLSRVNPQALATLRGTVSIYAFVPALVAAPVLCALVTRGPSSTKLVRWFWSHGRAILVIAAILDCAISIGASGVIGGDVADLDAGWLLAALFDVYFLLYILATRRIRDVFGDFPPAAAASGTKRRR